MMNIYNICSMVHVLILKLELETFVYDNLDTATTSYLSN